MADRGPRYNIDFFRDKAKNDFFLQAAQNLWIIDYARMHVSKKRQSDDVKSRNIMYAVLKIPMGIPKPVFRAYDEMEDDVLIGDELVPDDKVDAVLINRHLAGDEYVDPYVIFRVGLTNICDFKLHDAKDLLVDRFMLSKPENREYKGLIVKFSSYENNPKAILAGTAVNYGVAEERLDSIVEGNIELYRGCFERKVA